MEAEFQRRESLVPNLSALDTLSDGELRTLTKKLLEHSVFGKILMPVFCRIERQNRRTTRQQQTINISQSVITIGKDSTATLNMLKPFPCTQENVSTN
jgi:hypothetical protein